LPRCQGTTKADGETIGLFLRVQRLAKGCKLFIEFDSAGTTFGHANAASVGLKPTESQGLSVCL